MKANSLGYDFAGWATKNDLKCSDGRVIKRDAFADQDGTEVPIVWNHNHNDLSCVLGHAILENRKEGVYAYCMFNDTEAGENAKRLVRHGDIKALSIYANKLKQNGSNVIHGAIREISLVLAGANPGAVIESVMCHSSEGDVEEKDAFVCKMGFPLDICHYDDDEDEDEDEEYEEIEENVDDEEIEYEEDDEDLDEDLEEVEEDEEEENNDISHSDKEVNMAGKEKTVQDVIDGMSEEERTVLYALIGAAIEDTKKGENEEGDEEDMRHSAFDAYEEDENVLSHSDIEEICADAKRYGSMREAVLAHTDGYGIQNIDYLYPDAKTLTNAPEFIKRPTEWVGKFMNAIRSVPFEKIKTILADITEDEARALGYIKGNYKKEEFFQLIKRTTEACTVIKKQKLDRDEMIEITDLDIVSFLKSEMNIMWLEEVARAMLVGDGRNVMSQDKIPEDKIRPIWKDDDLFTIKAKVQVSAGADSATRANAFIKAAIRSRKKYRGTGAPILFTTDDVLTECLLLTDTTGRDIYDSVEKLATKLRVKEIVTVPVMENLHRTEDGQDLMLMGIIVNPADYTRGANKNGEKTMFDDFDIDYNQMKYLLEGRCSGCLTKPFSAIALELTYVAGLETDPEDPETVLFGKAVSDLQEGILVNANSIEGTLKYVTGYTGYSGDPALQKGNFIALKFTAPSDATTKVQLLGGHSGPVTLDSDMNAVLRIENNQQKVKVTTIAATGEENERIYSLGRLNLLNS